MSKFYFKVFDEVTKASTSLGATTKKLSASVAITKEDENEAEIGKVTNANEWLESEASSACCDVVDIQGWICSVNTVAKRMSCILPIYDPNFRGPYPPNSVK